MRTTIAAVACMLSFAAQAHGPNDPPHQMQSLGDLKLESGEAIRDFSISYVTHGRLNEKKSNAVLMVAQTDVVSLWSAGRVQAFLQEGAGRDRLRIVLTRYKKIPGFTEEDVEKATNCKVLWKVPNNFQVVGPAIDKATGRILFIDRQSTVAVDLSEQLAGKTALQDAGAKLTERMLPTLLK